MRTVVLSCILSFVVLGMIGCQKDNPSPKANTPKQGKVAKNKQGAKKTSSAKKKPQSKSFAFSTVVQPGKVGAAGKAALEVVPTAGYKLNPEYPWKAKIAEEKAVGVAAAVYAKDKWTMDASKAKLNMDIKPTKAGAHKIKATVNLSVCQTGGQKKCLWFNDEPVEIAVKAAP